MNPHKDCVMCGGSGKIVFTMTPYYFDKSIKVESKDVTVDCPCKTQDIQTTLTRDFGFPEKP